VTDVLPGAAVECHSHVVLTADPWRHLCLIRAVSTCYCLIRAVSTCYCLIRAVSAHVTA
jgi:hypothetical protein